MYNAKYVIPALLIFVGVLTYPLWAPQSGHTHTHAEHAKPKGEKCVESAEFMRANHMQLLDEWRHSVVRDQERIYVSTDGTQYEKSLTNTCLDCHDKKESCDSCHSYANVQPYCFTCHLDKKAPAQAITQVTPIAEEQVHEH